MIGYEQRRILSALHRNAFRSLPVITRKWAGRAVIKKEDQHLCNLALCIMKEFGYVEKVYVFRTEGAGFEAYRLTEVGNNFLCEAK